MIADLGSLRGHAGPCTLPLWGHKLCPLRALTSLQPDVTAPLRYFCSHFLRRMPATHSLDLSPLHFCSCPQQFYTLALFFSRPAKPPIFRAIPNSCFCVLLVRSVVVWEPRGFFLTHGELMGTGVHSSIPSSFLYNPKIRTIRLLGLPPVFTLISRWAYSTLKMDAICYSETSVDFQQTTGRCIPKDNNTHNQGCGNLKSYNQLINHNLYLASPQVVSSLQDFEPQFCIYFLFLHAC
jgi:hypothetical protein